MLVFGMITWKAFFTNFTVEFFICHVIECFQLKNQNKNVSIGRLDKNMQHLTPICNYRRFNHLFFNCPGPFRSGPGRTPEKSPARFARWLSESGIHNALAQPPAFRRFGAPRLGPTFKPGWGIPFALSPERPSVSAGPFPPPHWLKSGSSVPCLQHLWQ